MKNLKSEELGKLSDADLTRRLNELRTELAKLRSAAARGTLKKELGEIKAVRRNIARVLTVESSRRNTRRPVASGGTTTKAGSSSSTKAPASTSSAESSGAGKKDATGGSA